jgi:glycosyltransferase involved in cell wall biosynthesis
MTKSELVSIIVPSYKRDRELVERAVRSLLSQTYENIEIILVDDNAREDLQDFRKQLKDMVTDINNSRIVYVQNKENLGGAGARNEGINVCTGNYVTFLDDDDEYFSEKGNSSY